MQGTDGTRLSYAYDEHNNIQSYAAKKNGTTLSAASYTYTDEGLPVSAMLGGENGTPLTYTYDTLNRLESISVEASNGNLLETEYVYADGTDGQTTGVVEQVNYFIGFYEAPGEYSTYPMQAGDEYVYDKNGNITQIINNGGIRSYEYDELNRLVRENDGLLDQTVVYTYDNGGNILTKAYYDYTTGELGTVKDTVTYTYDGVWKDKLLTYDGGETITYDNIGNPLTYNGYTFTWQKGRQLASASGNGKTISYKYGADGLRTEKTVNGTTTEYTYASGLLVSQTSGTNTLNFSYTADGTPRTVKFNNTTYYYIYNLQGDVQSIVHANGGAVVEYVYDTWGNLISTTGTLASTLGTLNPFRYRGYVYDTETGLYYVSSRYYDPEIGRWISPEPNVYAGAFDSGSGLIGYNVYAYCANNPVNFSDPTGEFILTALIVGVVAGAVIGGAIGGTVAYNSAKSSGLEGSDLFWATAGGVGKGALIGGVAGGLVGATGGVVAAYGATSVAGTAMITATATITAKATEVTALQAKKSTNDGDNGWQIANDCIDSVFSNGGKIISPALTKAGTTSATYVATDLMKHKVVPLGFNTFLHSTGGKVLPYGFATYAWGHTAYSIFCTDPIARANQRGYGLR